MNRKGWIVRLLSTKFTLSILWCTLAFVRSRLNADLGGQEGCQADRNYVLSPLFESVT